MAILLLFTVSCDELIDEDISNETIEIIAPTDNLVTNKTTLTFWWNELDEAASYRLQIVTTHFDTVLSVPLDTLISKTKFSVTLNPNRYQWRVKAINSGSETEWFTRSFTIQDVPDLSDQEVPLRLPSNNAVFGKTSIKFQWYTIPNATNYALIVKKDTWDGNLAIPMEFTAKDTITKILPEGTYVWGIRGYNDNSQSKVQNRTFIIDLTAPQKPVLQTPSDNSTVSSLPVDLVWEYSSEDATEVYDSIYIAKDENFSSTSKLFFEKSTSKSYSLSTTYKGTVYWKVKTIDKAGNQGSFSEPFKFTIQ
jgi:hypothetical protein